MPGLPYFLPGFLYLLGSLYLLDVLNRDLLGTRVWCALNSFSCFLHLTCMMSFTGLGFLTALSACLALHSLIVSEFAGLYFIKWACADAHKDLSHQKHVLLIKSKSLASKTNPSHQKQIPHIKNKSLTSKTNPSHQKQIPHIKSKSPTS